jgi:hypothetical protein
MSVDIFIYFSVRLKTPRDVIEDALQRCLGDRGEVTGGGIGDRGANIDIEVLDEDGRTVVSDIEQVLKELGVPEDTWLVVDGERRDLFE